VSPLGAATALADGVLSGLFWAGSAGAILLLAAIGSAGAVWGTAMMINALHRRRFR
jgi:hypothetical protein